VTTSLVNSQKLRDGTFLVLSVTQRYSEIIRQITDDPRSVYQLRGRTFEELIAGAMFQYCTGLIRQHSVCLTRESRDGGRDLIVTGENVLSGHFRLLVEARGSKNPIAVKELRQFAFVLQHERNATKGLFVTTSRFTRDVERQFEDCIPNRLELVAGKRLVPWVKSLVMGPSHPGRF